MVLIVDFHIHSKYSRATSPQMTLELIHAAAQVKGISVIGTGDFTHPSWIKEIHEKLEPAEQGLFRLKKRYHADTQVFDSCRRDIRFILSGEISCIYSKNGRVRKVHMVVIASSLKHMDELHRQLKDIGNVHSDGRPILGLDAKELVRMCLEISPDMCLIPAHIWTPHFGVLGSESGFDFLEECFDELTPAIFALETGLSSDPAMNWRLSQLDRYALVSNSDAHSLEKLGREANIFDTSVSYSAIMQALKTKKGFLGTIEFFPEEGKYHLDGHRKCAVRLTPQETKKNKFMCPQCGKEVTVGVMHRVEKLADRADFWGQNSGDTKRIPGTRNKYMSPKIPFKHIIPLKEIISEYMECGVASKAVAKEYNRILSVLGSEFYVLLEAAISDIAEVSEKLAAGLQHVRNGQVSIEAGYDGVYGKISCIFSWEVIRQISGDT